MRGRVDASRSARLLLRRCRGSDGMRLRCGWGGKAARGIGGGGGGIGGPVSWCARTCPPAQITCLWLMNSIKLLCCCCAHLSAGAVARRGLAAAQEGGGEREEEGEASEVRKECLLPNGRLDRSCCW